MDARRKVVKHASKFQPPLRCSRQSLSEPSKIYDFDERGREIGRREGKGRGAGQRGILECFLIDP